MFSGPHVASRRPRNVIFTSDSTVASFLDTRQKKTSGKLSYGPKVGHLSASMNVLSSGYVTGKYKFAETVIV